MLPDREKLKLQNQIVARKDSSVSCVNQSMYFFPDQREINRVMQRKVYSIDILSPLYLLSMIKYSSLVSKIKQCGNIKLKLSDVTVSIRSP